MILGLIIVSVLVFTLESPLDNPDGERKRALLITDGIITIFFIIEIILKCLAYGLYYSGPKSYFRNWYNLIDTLVVLISVSFIY